MKVDIAKKEDLQLLNPKLINNPINKPDKAPFANAIINERTDIEDKSPSINMLNNPPKIIHNGIICA